MTCLSHLIIFLLALVIITPSQVPFLLIRSSLSSSQGLHSPKDFYKLLSKQSSSPKSNRNYSHSLTAVDQHYFDACTAILKGYDNVNDDSGYDHDFAEWENPNPDVTVTFNPEIIT
jgi:hypothetical protein